MVEKILRGLQSEYELARAPAHAPSLSGVDMELWTGLMKRSLEHLDGQANALRPKSYGLRANTADSDAGLGVLVDAGTRSGMMDPPLWTFGKFE
jgi:hypothetical protein